MNEVDPGKAPSLDRSLGCVVPDLLEDVERSQQKARGWYSRRVSRWQWHLVDPGQGVLGTTPVCESNQIARRDQNVKGGPASCNLTEPVRVLPG